MASVVPGYIGKVEIDPGNGVQQYAIGSTAYGVCSTTASVANKVVEMDGFELTEGATVFIKFVYTNTASAPKLNVNNTGSLEMKQYSNTSTDANLGTTDYSNGWRAGAVICFTYDGTYWVRDQGVNVDTRYSSASLGDGYGVCSTAATTAAKVVDSLSDGTYNAVIGGKPSIKFTYAVPENSTLNINSQGAKPIYFNGERIIAGIIKAGDVATFVYDGTNYHLIATSRWGSNIQTIAQNTYKNWDAGRSTQVSYSNEVLTIVNGVAPSLEQDIRSLL